MIARAALVFPVLLAVSACGGGSGTVSRSESSNQAPTASENQPAGSSANQMPSSSADQPPSASGSQPASGGDAGAAGGACIQCDVTYVCNGTANGQAVTGQSFSLSTDNGACTSNDVTITCEGKIVDPKTGAQVGTFTPLGNGSFAVSLPGVQLTCAPEEAQPPQAGGARDGG